MDASNSAVAQRKLFLTTGNSEVGFSFLCLVHVRITEKCWYEWKLLLGNWQRADYWTARQTVHFSDASLLETRTVGLLEVRTAVLWINLTAEVESRIYPQTASSKQMSWTHLSWGLHSVSCVISALWWLNLTNVTIRPDDLFVMFSLKISWVRCLGHVPWGGVSRADPGHTREVISLSRPGNASVLSWICWRKWLFREVWDSLLRLLHLWPGTR